MLIRNHFSAVAKFSIIVSLLLPNIVFARTLTMNLLAGGSTTRLASQTNIVFPSSSFRTDTFNASGTPIDFAIAAGAAYDFYICPKKYKKIGRFLRDVSLGINGYYNVTGRNGSVLEYGLPDFANSQYKLQVQSGRLMLDTELDFRSWWKNMRPFLQGGIGLALNTLNFTNSPFANIGANGGNYTLSDHTQAQFAYELGAGIKLPISKNVILSGRYLYANAGNAESTKQGSNGVSLGKPIKVSVESQSVLFGLSYLFG